MFPDALEAQNDLEPPTTLPTVPHTAPLGQLQAVSHFSHPVMLTIAIRHYCMLPTTSMSQRVFPIPVHHLRLLQPLMMHHCTCLHRFSPPNTHVPRRPSSAPSASPYYRSPLKLDEKRKLQLGWMKASPALREGVGYVLVLSFAVLRTHVGRGKMPDRRFSSPHHALSQCLYYLVGSQSTT